MVLSTVRILDMQFKSLGGDSSKGCLSCGVILLRPLHFLSIVLGFLTTKTVQWLSSIIRRHTWHIIIAPSQLKNVIKQSLSHFCISRYHLRNYMLTLFWYFLPKIHKNKNNNLKIKVFMLLGVHIIFLGKQRLRNVYASPSFNQKHLYNP